MAVYQAAIRVSQLLAPVLAGKKIHGALVFFPQQMFLAIPVLQSVVLAAYANPVCSASCLVFERPLERRSLGFRSTQENLRASRGPAANRLVILLLS